jgi:hypothetical protein
MQYHNYDSIFQGKFSCCDRACCTQHVLFGQFRAIAHGNVLSFCGNEDPRLKQNAKNCAQPPSFAPMIYPLRGDIRKNWNDTEKGSSARHDFYTEFRGAKLGRDFSFCAQERLLHLSHARVTLCLSGYHVMRSFKLSFEGTS